MQPIAEWMIRRRSFLLAVALVMTALLIPFSYQTEFDRSIDSFFDKDNPRFVIYNRVQEEFDGDTICLAVYSDPSLLTPDGIRLLEVFGQELADVEGVIKVQSLWSMPRPGGRPGILGKMFTSDRSDTSGLVEEILSTEVFQDQFVSRDGQTAVAIVLIDPAAIASGQFTQSLAQLRSICEERAGHIVGAPVMINDVYDYLEQDSWVLTNVSSWAMVFVVLSLFRRVRWMLLPMAVVQASLVWIKAMMFFTGIQLSLTGAMTTAMVTVIGIASAIHLAVRFREVSADEPDPVRGLERTLELVLPPIFWACATTAVGFGSLSISQVAPVHAFGIVMAIASMAVFLAVCLIMPGGILLGRKWFGVVPRPSFGQRQLADGLDGAGSFVGRHAWLASGVTLAVLVVAGYGMTRLEVETDFTKNFKESSSLLQGYRYVESRLGGAGLVDIVIDAPADLNEDFLNQLRSCEGRLRGIEGVTKVTSIVDMLDLIKANRFVISVLRTTQPPEFRQFWNPAEGKARIVLRVTEQQTTDGKERLLREINDVAKESMGKSTQVTGLYLLLVYLIDSLLSDQYSALALACVLNLAMMSLAFRSFRMGIVAFLPNVIPIVVTVGTMGWIGLKVNVATAMIQSISMGLAVDFSIHYLTRYRLERKRGLDFYPALAASHRNTGQAMVFADSALTLGFGILTLSHFLPTIQFGLLVCLAMLGGLVGNLVMLPVLLRVMYRVGPPRLAEEQELSASISKPWPK